MYRQLLTKLNQLAVTLYKSFGSTMLALILIGLLSYLAGQAFFVVNSSWAVPSVISPTDPKILELAGQVAEQSVARDRLVAERRSIQSQIADANRQIDAALSFQHQYRLAVRGEATARGKERQRLARLRREYDRTKDQVLASNDAFARLARTRAVSMHQAQLLDDEDFLTQNHAIAQLATTDLSLRQQESELTSRADTLDRELLALGALSNEDRNVALPPDLLGLREQFVRSTLELAQQERIKSDLQAQEADLDADLSRFDQLLATLRGSPYLDAVHAPMTVAFIPYDNLENAKPGTPVWGCALMFVWCHPVGTVRDLIPGEVQAQHPVRHLTLRGRMATLTLTDPDAAKNMLLHLGHAPLGF